VPAKTVYFEQIKKLMGWCPMKDSLRKERQENFFSGFKSKNGNLQLGSSPTGLQESKVLKAHVSFIDGRWILWVLIIVFFTLIVSLLTWAYNSPEGSFLILFSGLIWFLLPLMFLLNHPNTVAVMSGKIIIRKTLRKPVMIEREDVTQISVTKNKDHSYRWLFRLCYIVIIPLFFVVTILSDLRTLGGSAPEYPDISTFLIQLAQVTFFLVLIYNGELVTPYKQVINITTRSNLNLRLYIDEPEEIIGILKN
jgi:hypothetical protein